MNRMALKVSYEMALHTAVSKRHLDFIKVSKHINMFGSCSAVSDSLRYHGL